eukprot:GHVU01161706.1.p1 GENE.GHVU01161706.1~~GHVU01161706.1.p1  ORF type:complete len:471 (+),score=78.37 GHVU01161706.1:277-1689(+)
MRSVGAAAGSVEPSDGMTEEDFGRETRLYLERSQAFDLLERCVRRLVVEQPADPLAFMGDWISGQENSLGVVVLGHPSCNAGRVCDSLAATWGLRAIQSGDVIRKHVEEHQLSQELERMQARRLVSDVVACEAVIPEMQKGGKWILQGFPRTRVQARMMQLRRIQFDRFIVLTANESPRAPPSDPASDTPEDDCCSSCKEAETEKTIEQQHYFRHLSGVDEVFGPAIHWLRCCGGDGGLLTEEQIRRRVADHVDYRPDRPSALRQHRVCVVGQSGVGTTSVAAALADLLGAVHVDVALLIRKAFMDIQASSAGSAVERGTLFKPFQESDVLKLVEARLQEEDAQLRGWVLDGFPRDPLQASWMIDRRLVPRATVLLQEDRGTAKKRLEDRMIDPTTKLTVYRKTSSLELSVQRRLVPYPFHCRPRENEEVLQSHKAAEAFGGHFTSIRIEGRGVEGVAEEARTFVMEKCP